MDISDRICVFIKEEFLVEEPDTVVTEGTLLLDGIIDSMGLMQLVAFVEEEFGVEVEDADITAEHFQTVASIRELLQSRLTVAAGGGEL